LWRFAQELEDCRLGYRIDQAPTPVVEPIIPPEARPPREEVEALEDWETLLNWEFGDQSGEKQQATDRIVASHVPAAGLPNF
jgi:hypothetical protein